MNVLGTAAAMVLALVLTLAARAKMADRIGTARDFDTLGLIGANVLAVVVPVVEIATAVALVVAPPYGGPAAFALLAGFTVVLWRAEQFARQAGRPASCACFGGLSSEPISSRHFVRNAALMAMALAATASQWTLAQSLA